MPESSNTGGRKPRVSDRDLLDVFRSTADPVLSTAEVADAVPIKRRGVLNRLRDLEDAGELASKQIGGRNTVWWILDGGDADTFDAEELHGDPSTTLAGESGESDARADAVDDATDGPADPPADAHGADAAAEEDALDTARERVDELDLAGSGADYDRRRDAVLKMYRYLRERPGERVSKSDFADLLDGDDVGYGGG
ncbi:hypothetical protein, partial [Halorubrum sp. 48-1-W]|uniref:hypothetical protein n=1 Tax=Halorubrum sp. 48-1-W TaxID=2249761 RepID=UPI0018E50F74